MKHRVLVTSILVTTTSLLCFSKHSEFSIIPSRWLQQPRSVLWIIWVFIAIVSLSIFVISNNSILSNCYVVHFLIAGLFLFRVSTNNADDFVYFVNNEFLDEWVSTLFAQSVLEYVWLCPWADVDYLTLLFVVSPK